MIKLNKKIKDYLIILVVALLLCGLCYWIIQLAVECWNIIQQNLELIEALDSIKQANEDFARMSAERPWYDSHVIAYAIAPHFYFWPTVIFSWGGVLPWGLALHPAVSIFSFWLRLYYLGNRKGEYWPTIPDEQVDMNLPEPQETFTIVLDFLDANFALFILAGYLAFWLIFLIYLQFFKTEINRELNRKGFEY